MLVSVKETPCLNAFHAVIGTYNKINSKINSVISGIYFIQETSLWILWKSYFWFYWSLYSAAAMHDKAVEDQQPMTL